MDKELLDLLNNARQAGANETQLQSIVDAYNVKKKGSTPTPSPSPNGESQSQESNAPTQPDFNFINRKGESTFHGGDDPIGNTVNTLQSKRQSIIDRNIGSDNTSVNNHHPIAVINGKPVSVTTGSDEVNNLDSDIQDIKQNAFADPNKAKQYLTKRLQGKSIVAKNDVMQQSHIVTPNTDISNADVNSIKQNLPSGNLTDQLALDRIKKEQDIHEALSTSQDINEAALKYEAAQNPQLKKQIEYLQNTGEKIPDIMAGQLVSNFINQPDVQQKAQQDPNFASQLAQTQRDLLYQHPEYGKRIVAQKISQAREDAGLNNAIVNIPTQESTDKVVADLVQKGQLSPTEQSIYESQIKPSLGIMKSIGRGIGRALPFIQTGVDESPIATPGFLENTENSYVNTLHGMAHSIEDVANQTPIGMALPLPNNGDRLKQTLQNDYSNISIDPKGAWHSLGQSGGQMTGFVLPMIMGGAATKAIGAGATASELIPQGLVFEGQNKDNALKMFPNDPSEQFMYTTLATAGDLALGKLLPTGEARQGVRNLLKDDIKNVVGELTNGQIDAAAARNTILQKATKYVTDVAKSNLHTGAAMAGFGLLHNGLDAAFGGRDVSLAQTANDAIDNFKAGFLGGTPLSMVAALGGDAKLNGKVIREMAQNPDHYAEVINNQTKLNPDLKNVNDEKLQNLQDAASINKDLGQTNLTDPQKEKYIVQALNQRVWERKAAETTDDVIRQSYLDKANDSRKAKEKIFSGLDKAPEHENYVEPQTQNADQLKQADEVKPEIKNENEVQQPTEVEGNINTKTTETTLPTSKTEEPKSSQEPISESKFPKPEKPIHEMNSDELDKYAQTVRDYNRGLEKEFFGEEGAKKYREAQSISNNYLIHSSDPRYKEANALIDKMENSLTEQQKNEFYGMNAPDGLIYDDAEIRDIGRKVRIVEDAENIDELSNSVKNALSGFDKDRPSNEKLAILNAAKKKATELKINPKDLIKKVLEKVGGQYKDIEDAEFMMKNAYENLTKPNEAQKKISETTLPTTESKTEEPIAEKGLKLNDFKIKPSPDDIKNVADANGLNISSEKKEVPIKSLSLGKSLNQPEEIKRVQDLKNQITSDKGYIARVIVDGQGNVIEGQHRVKAMQELGFDKVPVIELKGADDFINNVSKIKDILKENGVSKSDQRNQIVNHLATILSDEKGDVNELKNYDAPKGYEKAWDEAVKEIESDNINKQTNETERQEKGNKHTIQVSNEGTINGEQTKVGTAFTEKEKKGKESQKSEPIAEQTVGGEQIQLQNKNSEPPPDVPKEEVNLKEGDGREVGVSHSALTELSNRLGLKEPERGKFPDLNSIADRGRALLEGGAKPDEVLNEDNKLTDRIAIARAHLENLVSNADEIAKNEKMGVGSEEYREAIKKVDDYKNDVVKKLGTDAGMALYSLRGVRDLDTGSFTAVKNAFEKNNGYKASAEQDAKIKELTDRYNDLSKRTKDLEDKVIELTDKELNKPTESESKQKGKFEKQFKDIADKFRKLKSKEFKFKGEDGKEYDITKMGMSWNDIVEFGAKAIEKTGQIADGVAEIIDKIKDSDFYKGLTDKDKQNFQDQLTKHYQDELDATPEGKELQKLRNRKEKLESGNIDKKNKPEINFTDAQKAEYEQLKKDIKKLEENLGLKKKIGAEAVKTPQIANDTIKRLGDLQDMFADKKKGSKFTPDEAKALWNYAKQEYLNKGVSYKDMIGFVSNDTGLSWNDVYKGITSPKIERISDEMWKQQANLRRQKIGVEDFVKKQNNTIVGKALQKVSDFFRGTAVFGHGGIFVGTHAGMTLFDLPRAKYTIKAFLKAWKFAYGNKAEYERQIEALKSRPNFVTAERAGLQNNPAETNIDEYQKFQKIFDKIGGQSGVRGFNAIKVLRQDLFDAHYNKLSDVEKADPESAKSIAHLVNNATGGTNVKIPTWVNEVTFAGGMEVARWQKLTANPIKASTTALKAIFTPDKATTSEKVFAKIWAKRVGSEIATYAGLLAANAALQSIVNPKNPVNLTDPSQSDFFKFKANENTVDMTSGMAGAIIFAGRIYQVSSESQKQLRGDTRLEAFGKNLVGYGRGKLSPFAGTATEMLIAKTDYSGNPLPFNNDKPRTGRHKLTWTEYAEEKLPIPVADAFKTMNDAMRENGMNEKQRNMWLEGLVTMAEAGTTGFRISESYQRPTKFTDEDKKDPVFKYWIDKGFALPEVANSKVKVADKKNKQIVPLSTRPPEEQAAYDALHKANLKNELQTIEKKKYVFKDDYGDISITKDYGSSDKRETSKKVVPINTLTKDEMAKVLSRAQSEATKKTNEKLYPKY